MNLVYKKFAAFLEKRFRFDAHYFLSGGFWIGLSQAATATFGLITTVLLAHYLDTQDYGVYRYLISLAAIFSVFSLTGLGQSVIQTAAKGYRGFYEETTSINFLYSLGISVIAAVFAGYYWLNGNLILTTGCLLIALLQPVINTFQFMPALLHGLKKYQELTTLQTVRITFISIVTIIGIFLTQNILILFALYLSSYLISNLVSHLIYRSKNARIPSEIKQKYLQYAKHTSIRNIISNTSQKIDSIIVFTQLGAIELAVYTIANVIPEQIKGSIKSMMGLLLPKYSSQTDFEVTKKSIPRRSMQLFLILVCITILYVLFIPFVYQILFPKFPEAVLYSQISALAFPAFILLVPYTALQARLDESALYKLTWITSLFQMFAVFAGIYAYGILGAILARIGYRYFLMTVTYFLLFKSK